MSPCDRNEVLYPARMDLPADIRRYVIQLLNQSLACTVDLRSHVKQAGQSPRVMRTGPRRQGPRASSHESARTGRAPLERHPTTDGCPPEDRPVPR
jgi:hypothetical protein